MIPNNWKELPLKTSPEFLEEIGFRGTVPSGHPIGVLAAAKNALREHFSKEINKLKVLRQRYCMLYYAGHDPRQNRYGGGMVGAVSGGFLYRRMRVRMVPRSES